jgi:hypothetical protein
VNADGDVTRLIAELGTAFTAAGVGIRQAAYAAEVSPGTIRNLLAGQRIPRVDVFSRVSLFLGFRIELDTHGGRRRTDGKSAPMPTLRREPYIQPLKTIEQISLAHRWAATTHLLIAVELLWVFENELDLTYAEAASAWDIDIWTLRRLLWRETSPRLDTLMRIAAGADRRVVLTASDGPDRVMRWEGNVGH